MVAFFATFLVPATSNRAEHAASPGLGIINRCRGLDPSNLSISTAVFLPTASALLLHNDLRAPRRLYARPCQPALRPLQELRNVTIVLHADLHQVL